MPVTQGNRSSANGGQAANLPGRNALHVLIVSALALCGAVMAGHAQASSSGSSNQNLPRATTDILIQALRFFAFAASIQNLE